jgi:hypothetical protein
MELPNTETIATAGTAAAAGSGVMIAIAKWLLNRAVSDYDKRLEALDKKHDEFKEHMMQEVSNLYELNQNLQRELLTAVGELKASVARIEGREDAYQKTSTQLLKKG